jgi:ABC-type glycerol-3-phosphate transport system substrate-binding protein
MLSYLDEDLLPWFYTDGSKIMFEKNGKWVVEFGEGGRDTLKFFYDMINTHKVMSIDDIGLDGTAQRSAFEGQLIAMMQTGCWARRLLMEEAPEVDFVYVPIPVVKEMATSAEVQGISVNKETKNLDEALEVAKFFISPYVSSVVAWGDCILTPRISGMSALHLTSSRESWDIVNAYQKFARPWPTHPAWAPFGDQYFTPLTHEYLLGNMSLEEAVEAMEEEGNILIEDYS